MGLYADQLAVEQEPGDLPEKAARLPPRRMSASPPPSRGPGRYRSYSRSRSRSPGGGEDNGNTTVFVGNLAHDMADRTLRDFFSTWGNVLEVKIILDMETGRSRGFGFIKFDDARDADDAIAGADGKVLAGRTIKCNMAKYPRGGGTFRGGFRGGPPRGNFRGRDGGRGGGRFGPPDRFRSRSGSPGRYSPGRYSPARSDSGYSSRSRPGSGSPPAKRRRPRSPVRPPPRAAGRRLRKPSRSGSYSSASHSSGSDYSTTDSELSRSPPRRGPPPPGVPPPAVLPPGAGAVAPPGQFKKELMQAKRRESEMAARLAALEGEVHKARTANQSQLAQSDDLNDRLVASEKACKKYREWLVAMVESANAVLLAQQQLTAAEKNAKQSHVDLALYVKEAEDLINTTAKPHTSRRRRRDKEPRPDADGVATGGLPDAGAGAPAIEAAAASGLPASGEGGWGDGMDVADGEDASAKFKPGIKFKLAT